MVLDEIRKAHEEVMSRMEGIHVCRGRTIDNLNENTDSFISNYNNKLVIAKRRQTNNNKATIDKMKER